MSFNTPPLAPDILERLIKSLDAEYARINLHRNKTKSPAEQFDESHKRWLKGGRES